MSSQPSERTGALSGADHDVPSRIGPYRVERRLGRGGMGEVWSAFDDRLGRRVALKRVLEGTTNPRAKARLRLEARSLAKLSHPSIVKIHDWIELEHDTWFVMEFVNGRTLDHWKPGSLPDVDWVVRIGARIALGLAAAHGSGVVHRDLKLSNVMITDAGQVKILDFGLAKRLDQRAVQSLTGDRHVLGSAGSMAPEQILGGEVDGRTDLFAFGVLLYRLLLGVPPFAGTSTLRVLKSTCADPHPALRPTRPEIPQPLEELIDRLLAKDRTDRPDGAAEVADLLHAMAAQDGDSGLQSGQRDSNDLQAERIPVAILLMKAGSTTELAAAREAFEAVVDELSGVVEDAPDDRSLALFGYPEVLEDNAKRAVYAGLEILRRVPLTTVAVHAGTALALSDLDGAELALGPLFDQSGDHLALAEAGSLRVSPEAHTLCADAFHWHEVDRNGYVPTGVKEADFGRRPAVPLVARDVELQQILDAWERARQGEGQVVVVGGEAGLGKSRLLTEVRTRLGRHETVPAWVTAFSSPLSSATPFEPIARVLRIQSGTEVATSPEAKLAALEEWLRQAALDLPELAPWLALVLGIPTAGRYPSEQMGPSLRKRRILEALASTILELAQRQPSVVVLEDLHWADPSTLEVLDLLVEQAHSVPLLLIMSHRLEYRPPWVDRPDVSWIRLQRLAPTQVEEQISMLVEQVSGVSADLPRELLQRVAERADGVPLFVEELLRAVVEAENWDDDAHRQLADAAVPQSLRESLMARLARLGPAKAMAQRASVIGRTFGIEILASVAEIPQPVLEDGLEQLVRAEILIRRGFGPRTRFVFRHALLRDAAYESLLRRDRKRLHRKVAEFLESQDGTRPELLARHQTLGGTWAAAARNWQSAAMEAQLQSAFLEAVEHGRAAIDALSKARRRLRSPEAREQADRRELTMQTQLGAALAATQGYAAPELAEVYGRARCLCDRLGNDPGLVWVLWGLYAYHVVESRLHEALELADQLLRITETDDDPIPRLVALAAKAVALYFHGDVEEAYEIALEAAALDDPSRSEHLHRATGQDMGANVLSCVSLAAWHLGRTEDALETSSASLELAQRIEHPFSIAFTGSWAARLHQSLRDADGCRRLAEVVRQASETRGYFWTTQAHFFSGCAAAEELRRRVDTGASVGAEEWSDALAEMRTGLDSYRATGARLSQSYMLAQIAEVQLWAGQLEPARESIRDAMAAATTGREGYWRSELHRLAGEVEMAGEAPDLESAEADLVIAKDLATAAGDRALLQRAESSLQRLYDFLHLPRDADRPEGG